MQAVLDQPRTTNLPQVIALWEDQKYSNLLAHRVHFMVLVMLQYNSAHVPAEDRSLSRNCFVPAVTCLVFDCPTCRTLQGL